MVEPLTAPRWKSHVTFTHISSVKANPGANPDSGGVGMCNSSIERGSEHFPKVLQSLQNYRNSYGFYKISDGTEPYFLPAKKKNVLEVFPCNANRSVSFLNSCIACHRMDGCTRVQLVPDLKAFKLLLIFLLSQTRVQQISFTCPLRICVSIPPGQEQRGGIADEQLSKGTVPVFSLYPDGAHSLGEFQRKFNNRTVYKEQRSPPGLVRWGLSLPLGPKEQEERAVSRHGGGELCGKGWVKPAQCGPVARSQGNKCLNSLFSPLSYWADLNQMTESQGVC